MTNNNDDKQQQATNNNDDKQTTRRAGKTKHSLRVKPWEHETNANTNDSAKHRAAKISIASS